MRRIRLAILGDSPCHRCVAQCCKQNGHEYAVLLEGDERRRFAAYSITIRIGHGPHAPTERVIPYQNGRCGFLGDDDRCTIYADRPVNCRRFQCVPGYHLGGTDLTTHSEFMRRNPHVLKMLDGL